MNKGLLTTVLCMLLGATFLNAQNPQGDLRIEMLNYYNLVIDHNNQSTSPESVYIGVQICNDGGNDMSDVFAFIGDHAAGTPGIYPVTVAPGNRPYSGSFSFNHVGGAGDATRYIGDLAAGECITQYWLLQYPLVDGNGVPLFGANSKTWDDLDLSYDVWATADDNGALLEAEDSKSVKLRAELSASANKIWPNNTNRVPDEYLDAFPERELGWHETTNTTHPGAVLALEGNWFRLGRVNKGFDNDGDYQKDYNFMIQPVGNPGLFDANCYRLVKVSGLIIIKQNNGQILEIPFEDRMHFENLPTNNTDGVGFVTYEFAVLNGPCSSQLTPYQGAASGNNREKYNQDFGTPGGSLTSVAPNIELEANAPANTQPSAQITLELTSENTSSEALGLPEHGAPIVFQQRIPDNTQYVAGTASNNNTLPGATGVTILYSTDNGINWDTDEPSPASSATNIQWWFDSRFNSGEIATVRYDIFVPPTYSESAISADGGISIGSAEPFIDVTTTILLDGGLSISDVVFLDNGDGNATLGDGVQTGTEPGVADITVKLFTDSNNNGQLDNSDVFVTSVQTQPDGSFEFSDLSEANYVVAVDKDDADLPQGSTNTTALEIFVDDLTDGGNATFGFAPLLELRNILVTDPEAFEESNVEYQLQIENLAYAVDSDNSSTVTAWASQLDPATNWSFNKDKLLGPPDVDLAWPSTWSQKAVVKDFDFGPQAGAIEKVELVFSVCLDYAVNNDYLVISFQKEDGTTVVVPDPGLSKTSTPSLNDYVGPPGLGFIILDVTQFQDWTWDIFDQDWAITVDGIIVGGNDGSKQYTDAIGVRVTSSCCASSGGEPGNPYATISELPLNYEYDSTQLDFVSSTVTPDNISNGIITFDDLAPVHPNEIKTIDLVFQAKQPIGEPIINTAVVTEGQNGDGLLITDSADSDPVSVVNLGSVSGVIFGDTDDDGWKGTVGYEVGVDNFMPSVEMILFACVDDNGDLIYPAPNKWKSCTHWQNDGHWEAVRTTASDENGEYRIAGVDNGYYYLEVDETTMSNVVIQTADPDYTTGVAGNWADKRWKNPNSKLKDVGLIGIGNDHTNVNFGYGVEETIAGVVWNDVNGDGVKDDSEAAIPNVTVTFDHSGCSDCPTVHTNGAGEYTFSANAGVDYTVSIDLNNIQGADSWLVTEEQDGTLDNSFNVTLAVGQQLFEQNIGVQAAGDMSMGGKVYYDWLGNAHIDAGDEGMSGVTVKLYRDYNNNGTVQSSDQLIQSIQTDINGDYLFANKPAGSYVIQVEESTIVIFPKQTDDPDEYGPCTDCDAKTSIIEADYVASVTDQWNYSNTYTSCKICSEAYTSTDKTYYQTNNLDVINFQDPIGNASACVSQVAVTFRVAASDFEKSYYTSQVDQIDYDYPIELNGIQIGTFDPVEMAYACSVCEEVTILYDVDMSTIPYNYGGNNQLDLNFSSYNLAQPAGQRSDVCVADIGLEFIGADCGENYLTLDFGYQPIGDGVIEGCVYEDDNGNAFENSSEPRIDDVEVRLEADYNNNGTFVQMRTTTTDPSGEFRFSNLPNGYYRTAVNPTDTDLPLDPLGNPPPMTTPESYVVEVVDGSVVSVNNEPCSGPCDTELPAFGFAPAGRIHGTIFSDDNGNGTSDVGEEGIVGVTVYLCNTADGYCDATNAIDSTTTSAGGGFEPEGYFRFYGLDEGDFTVAVNESSLPNYGYELTTDPSTDGIPCYSPLDPADPNYDFLLAECEGTDKGINVTFGTEYTGATFGYQPRGSIGDIIWFDDNEDGVVDEIEEGLEDIEISVRNVSQVTQDGTVYEPGEFTEITVTDSDGQYSFSRLPDGVYDVEVTAPIDHVATYDPDGTPDNTTQIVIVNGEITNTGNSWCPIGQDCSFDLIFGLRPNYLNSVAGVVCLDSDEDGKCNTGGETFPEGSEIAVYDNVGTFYGQMAVGVDGSFFFDNLPTTDLVLTVSKTNAPLRLTSMTTSLGDTPAYDVEDSEDNALQWVNISGDVTGMDFGFTFSDTFDLGDLPLPYPTLVDGTANGPAHRLPENPTLYLGNSVDWEPTVALQPGADGDNADEDGVTFSDPATWAEGTDGGSMTVDVTGDGHLVAFADFNMDGDFGDPGEMITNLPVNTGAHVIDFDIPTGTVISGGQDFYFRIRLFPTAPFSPATAYAGIAEGGEVEDYRVSVCKNIVDPGTITGTETGCDAYDAAEITATHAPSGGGGTLEYQWQLSTDGGVTWSEIAGATSESYDPGIINESTRFQRGARRSRCADFIYSNVVVKAVVTNYNDPGAIVGNEEHCGIYDPEVITNVIAPSGGLGTTNPEYQWQASTDGGATWTDIVNAHDEYFDPGVISHTTEYRRGARKSPCAPYLYSNPITKLVSVNYIDAGTIDGDQSVCGAYDPTEIASLTLPSGGTDGYEVMQWEMSTNGGASWTNIAGAFGETYDPGVITETTLYRRKARRVPCTIWVNSNVVTKTVKPYPVASIISFPVSGSGFLCELTDYEFTAEDAGGTTIYDWDFGTYGVPAAAQGIGPHHPQFDVPDGDVLTNTNVTLTTTLNGCVSTDSKNFFFRPEIEVDSVTTQDPVQCQAKNGKLWIHATYPAGANVQYSVDGGLSWQSDYEFDNLGAGVYDIRVRYVGGDCAESYGNVALSDPPPQSIMLVSSSEECTDQTIVIEAIPINSNPVFTWTFGGGAIPNTASGPGPHSVYFTQGGNAHIAVTMEENNCIGVRDTNIAIVDNFVDGGTILGGETLCSTFDPTNIMAGSNPSGGVGGTIVYQWEYRESDGLGGWGPWQDVAGADATSHDPALISVTTEFRRKARRAPCSDWVYSNSVAARLVTKPNLADDTYFTVCPGFPHADNVSDNDVDLSDPSYSLLVFPTNGTIDFEADGEFIYDPNSTFCGTDEFQYLVCNENTGCCDTAAVLVDLTDGAAPTITNVPADITISCDDQIPVADAVDVIENCQTVSLSMDEFSTQGVDSCSFFTYQWIRIWNGVDYCSNTASAQQTINVQDNTSPDIYRIYTLPNGKKMVAGVMENVSNHWKTVALPIQFATQPVIFTQVVSRNEPSAVNARLRNVSTTQFQLKLQEEEANDGVHTQENVAWVAFEKGALAGGFEVDSWLVTDAILNGAFGQTFAATPNVFATVQTTNEIDPINVRVNAVSTTGVDAWLQEETSADPETVHNLETVGYFAVANTGDLTTASGEAFGEVGTIALTDASTIVNLTHKYHNPVVIFGAVPNGEHEPVTVRVNSVTATSFEVQLEEWDFLDGVHAAESIPYMVIEGSLPFDREVPCDDIPDPLAVGFEIIAVDNCDATIELKMTESDYAFDCMADTTFTRTWYSVDDCGNETALKQTFRLIDTEAPEFTAPANVTIVCGDDKDDLSLTGEVEDATDNCTEDVEAVYTDNLTNLVNCFGFITRTWTATDNCGNASQHVQLIFVSPETDSDNDGVVDHFDLDDDNDGIADLVEGFDDFDQDGVPNNLDLDSDNDGIPDLLEINGQDIDGDGVVDIVGIDDWDYDGDGFAYGFDGNDIDTMVVASVVFDINSIENDRDQDGIPNFLDRDSDNDGIADLVEAGGVDTNGDGVIDYPVGNDPLTMIDADADGFSDTYDPEDDLEEDIDDPQDPLLIFNGIFFKGGSSVFNPDFDGDMVPDYLDSDSDNDGTGDLIEAGGIDTDGDGKLELNGSFVDANNDGFNDLYVTYPLVSTDGDGETEDGRPEDTDGDGTAYTAGDFDFDNRPNHRDYDSDADNIIDIFETGLSARDTDGNGIIDNFNDTNLNGFDDIAEASANILTETDGFTIDGRPEDSGDADESAYLGAAPDGAFARLNGNPDVDDDADNILNFVDWDSDNDLLPDAKEDKDGNGKQDDGETGTYNPDSDDDLILDGIEDYNRNGVYEPSETNPLDPNTDGDPLLDGEEDENRNGIVDGLESDPRDPCDPILNDACRGIVLDITVKLMGARIEGDTTNLMRDNLRDDLLLPDHEPYSMLSQFSHLGEDVFEPYQDSTATGGTTPGTFNGVGFGNFEFNGEFREYCNLGNFYVTGNDAPVDWVMVELRSAVMPDSIIATRAGLLQRDGDIRDIDGISYLTFTNIPSGSFYVAVRHRNHLGVMTATPLVLSPDPTRIDFTDPATPVYGDNSMASMDDEMALWAGDLNGDGYVIYQGPGNDVLRLFQHIMLDPDNVNDLANYIRPGYTESDFNMDGSTIFQGPGNERAKILLYSILGSPTNNLGLANFILLQNLP